MVLANPMYIRYFRQGCYQIYSHMSYTVYIYGSGQPWLQDYKQCPCVSLLCTLQIEVIAFCGQPCAILEELHLKAARVLHSFCIVEWSYSLPWSAARQFGKAYVYAAYMFVLLYPLQGEVMALRGQLAARQIGKAYE